jgi:hypothetical protein
MISDKSDRLGTGFFLGCAWMFAFFALAQGLGKVVEMTLGPGIFSLSVFFIWGITVWIALVPLIMKQTAAGHPRTAKGLKISGFFGLFLSAGSAVLLLWGLSIAIRNIP